MRRAPPKLPTDYLDAMKRHWEDAELFWNQEPKRLANADQLYVLVAECGLKALMTRLVDGYFDHNYGRPSNRTDRVHADEIWDCYINYLQGGAAARYALPTDLPTDTNPFEQWEIDDRYANRMHFGQARVNGHRGAALIVKQLVDRAVSQTDLP
jgi:hypothetical protein